MSSEQELLQRSQSTVLAELRNATALLYPDDSSARRIVADAGLDARQIAFDSRATNNWHHIWLAAIHQHQVDTLLDVLTKEYPDNPPLQAAIVNYQHFLATGGRLNAQAFLADSTTDDDAPAPGDPPYQGMAYYDVADADRFFGREALTAELAEYFKGHTFLAIIGASGSGKSSLVRAGLISLLRDGQSPSVSDWSIHIVTPTRYPLKTLAEALTLDETSSVTLQLQDEMLADPRILGIHLSKLRRKAEKQRLLLLVDQFEELFANYYDADKTVERATRRAYVLNLLYAAGITSPTEAPLPQDNPVCIILTLRADFYVHCAEIPELWTVLERYQKNIMAMTPDELLCAIEEPAKAGEWELQAGLVEQLLHDVGDEPGALPLLSHALLETWQRRRGRTLTLAGYRAAGGVQGAIAKSADDVFNRFTDEQKSIARILFLRLTELGEGVQDTRRRVRPSELKLTQANPEAVQQVLKTLADARLVTTDEDEVQVAHEALIRNWETLRAWLDDDREGHRIQRRLTEAANQWVEFGKESALLYRGVLLQQAQGWLQSTIDPPNQIEMEFLQESQKADEKARKRQRLVTQLLTTLTVIALLAAGAFWVQTRRVNSRNDQLKTTNVQLDRKNQELDQTNVRLSDTITQLSQTVDELDATNNQLEQTTSVAISRQLGAQSTIELTRGRYESAILLALAAGQTADTLEAFSAIRAAIAYPGHSRLVFYGHRRDITQATWNQNGSKILTTSIDDRTARIWDAMTGEELLRFDEVYDALWNRDESKVLTRGVSDKVRIWDAVTGKELVRLTGHTGSVWQASWNQDESKVLTNSNDGTARIWDAVTGKELVRLTGHTGSVLQAGWSQDESKVFTHSDDRRVRIWDAVTGKELVRLTGQIGSVLQAGWSQDGSKILTNNNDDMVGIWDAATGKELVRLTGHTDYVWPASWNQDESKVLTNSNDGTARIWDAVTGKELVRLTGHTGSVLQAGWSRDESKILTSGHDGTARIWDTATGKELVRLTGHTGSVLQAGWSQDESKILTSSQDGTARIWDAVTGKELVRLAGHTGSVRQASWNRDESKVLTSSQEGTMRIWYAATDQELVRLTGHTGSVLQAGWSRDENKVFTSSADNTARIWDATTDKELIKLAEVQQTTWSKDESRILTASNDGTSRIWDVTTGKELVRFEGHARSVTQANWSADESKIVTLSADGTERIWDAVTGQELVQLVGHEDMVYQVIWNKNNSKILTSSEDGTARIWNAVTGQEIVRFQGHSHRVYQAIWNKDESKVLTRSDDGTARVWDATTGRELLKLAEHVGVVTQAVWNQDESKILTRSIDYDFISNTTVPIWNAVTGQELIRLVGHTDDVLLVTWSKDSNKVLTTSRDMTARIWNAITGQELIRFNGHTDAVTQAIWNQSESLVLTRSDDGTARIWDAVTGHELARLEGHTGAIKQAVWSKDERKILTSSDDGTVRIWYVQMADLLIAACKWVPRNFTWSEWSLYLQRVQGNYHPTCPNALIPPDVIDGIQGEVRQQLLAGQVVSSTLRLEELNGWLQVNGQFKSYGVDVDTFVAEVSATATIETLPSPTLSSIPNVAPSPIQPASPLRAQSTSPLPSPTVMPRATGTPVASAPVATTVRLPSSP